MPKIVIDDTETLNAGVIESLERLASFFDRLDDPYRMPQTMADWLDAQNSSGVDSYYAIPVGYGANAMQLRFVFKKNMIIMEFLDPYGTRLMELRLHK